MFGVVATTDSRPCALRRPSMVAGYFLLLAQKKVTKEKGTLGFAPSAALRVRCGRTGSAHRPSMACCPNRRDPSRRPRAVHAADPSALRRCSEGSRKAEWKDTHAGTRGRCRTWELIREGVAGGRKFSPCAGHTAGRVIRTSDHFVQLSCFDLLCCVYVLPCCCPEPAECSGSLCCCLEFQ